MIVEKTLVDPPERPDAAALPVKIGKYEIQGLIGTGSSGQVYRSFDPFVQRTVAVKTMRGAEDDFHDEESARRAFFSEARAAGMLSHPHIVSIYDAGSEGGMNYLVMEYIDGDTLAPACRKTGVRLPLEQVVDIIFKCAKALDYSHSRGVLHRDIKPSNIMLTRDGVPKVMDFSVAEVRDPLAAGERKGDAVGSPLYMPPEQVQRAKLTPASDLYSLGVVMYQLLTGEAPYTGSNLPELFAAIRNAPLPSIAVKRPDLPRDLCALIHRLLAKRAELRYQSGGELATELLQVFERLTQADASLSRSENRDSLRSLRFFDAFSESQINEVLNASHLLSYAPGVEIVREGEIDNAFYLIAQGTAEGRRGSTPVFTLLKGDCFGELGFLTGMRRTATVVAATPVLALRVSSTLLDQASSECQLHFYKTFTQSMIQRLTLTNVRLKPPKA